MSKTSRKASKGLTYTQLKYQKVNKESGVKEVMTEKFSKLMRYKTVDPRNRE